MSELDETPFELMTLDDYRECWLLHPNDDNDCEPCPNIDICKKLREDCE